MPHYGIFSAYSSVITSHIITDMRTCAHSHPQMRVGDTIAWEHDMHHGLVRHTHARMHPHAQPQPGNRN